MTFLLFIYFTLSLCFKYDFEYKSDESISSSSANENEHENHIFILFSTLEEHIDIFQQVQSSLKSLTYFNDFQDINFSVEFAGKAKSDCPNSLTSCLVYFTPGEIDRTCLLGHLEPRRYRSTYEGDLSSYDNVYQFVRDKVGFTWNEIPNLNISTPPKHFILESNSNCDVVDIRDIHSANFITNHWLAQKPLVIKNFFYINTSASHDILSLLKKYESEVVGVKLSPSHEYEGVDLVSNWGMHSSQRVPDEVMSQLQSPNLVVVRPAHVEMRLKDILDLIAVEENKGNKKW